MSTPIYDSEQLQSLIVQANQGNPKAYTQLIEQAEQRLKAMARAMLRNYPHLRRWEETDDVFQNTMIRLHRSLLEVKPDSLPAFLGLVGALIRRALIDLIRHHFGPMGYGANHHSDRLADTQETIGGFIETAPDSGGKPESLEGWAAFHEAVELLPDSEREIFDLVWYAGMQQAEIADALGVSLPTVQRRWQRARALLYHALQGEGPNP